MLADWYTDGVNPAHLANLSEFGKSCAFPISARRIAAPINPTPGFPSYGYVRLHKMASI